METSSKIEDVHVPTPNNSHTTIYPVSTNVDQETYLAKIATASKKEEEEKNTEKNSDFLCQDNK